MVNEKVSDGLKQPLFDLLSSRYDLLPLQSELDDIIDVCVGIHRERAAVKSDAVEFGKYVKWARDDFSKVVRKYSVDEHNELRTAVDDILIAYDQLSERSERFSHEQVQAIRAIAKEEMEKITESDFVAKKINDKLTTVLEDVSYL